MDKFPKKLQAQIIAHLSRISYRNIHYKMAMDACHKGRGQWECSQCRQIYPNRSDLHGDHIEPRISPETGFIDWNTYMERTFLGLIQGLCKICHSKKTLLENEIRTNKRRKNKCSSTNC